MKNVLRNQENLRPLSTVPIEDIDVVFSSRPQLLDEYYAIREKCYREVENGPKDFNGGEDEYDLISDIALAKYRGKVIGGMRLTGTTKNWPILMPMEETDFMLRELFPHYNLKESGYCEFSRLAVLKEFRNFELLTKICDQLIQKAAARGYGYLFSFTPLPQARAYRLVQKTLKLNPYIIHKDIKTPQKDQDETGDLKMYLSSLKLPTKEEMQNLLLKRQDISTPRSLKAA